MHIIYGCWLHVLRVGCLLGDWPVHWDIILRADTCHLCDCGKVEI